MKLYLLRPREDMPERSPWEPWYDKCFGFVVRAESETEAREFADAGAGSENDDEKEGTLRPWLDKELSDCEELSDAGEAGVVISDFHAA